MMQDKKDWTKHYEDGRRVDEIVGLANNGLDSGYIDVGCDLWNIGYKLSTTITAI